MAAVSHPVPSIVEEAADLERSAAEIEEAAWHEGVDPLGVLGVFIRALKSALVKLARLLSRYDTAAAERIAATRELDGKREQTLDQMLQVSHTLLKQAKVVMAVTEVEREASLTKLVRDLGPQLADKLREFVVFRERELNRRAARRRAALTGAAVLVLVGSGYGFRAWQDDAATGALQRCLAAKFTVPTTGQLFCNLDTLMPPSPTQ